MFRINLTHEIQREKSAQRRDPLKLTILGACLILVGVVINHVFLSMGVGKLVRESRARSGELAQLQPTAKAAEAMQKAKAPVVTTARVLNDRIEKRILWGLILEQFCGVLPSHIQIDSFRGNVSTDGKRRVTIQLIGKAAGEDPRRVAEEFRLSLRDTFGKKYVEASSKFSSLEDGTAMAELEGKQLPTAIFTIDLGFQPEDTSKASTKAPGAPAAIPAVTKGGKGNEND